MEMRCRQAVILQGGRGEPRRGLAFVAAEQSEPAGAAYNKLRQKRGKSVYAMALLLSKRRANAAAGFPRGLTGMAFVILDGKNHSGSMPIAEASGRAVDNCGIRWYRTL